MFACLLLWVLCTLLLGWDHRLHGGGEAHAWILVTRPPCGPHLLRSFQPATDMLALMATSPGAVVGELQSGTWQGLGLVFTSREHMPRAEAQCCAGHYRLQPKELKVQLEASSPHIVLHAQPDLTQLGTQPQVTARGHCYPGCERGGAVTVEGQRVSAEKSSTPFLCPTALPP